MDLALGILQVLLIGEYRMSILYFDCFSGICGDMILGALIDIGIDKKFFKDEIKKLNLSGYEINFKKIKYKDFSATDVDIIVSKQKHHRNLDDIDKIMTGAQGTEPQEDHAPETDSSQDSQD